MTLMFELPCFYAFFFVFFSAQNKNTGNGLIGGFAVFGDVLIKDLLQSFFIQLLQLFDLDPRGTALEVWSE